MAANKIDARQSRLTSAQSMLGSSAGDTLDTIFPKINDELAKHFEDRNILLTDGGIITFTGTQIQFTENLNLVINQKISGASPQVISLGSANVNLNNGEMWYATVNRTTGTATTAVASTLPAVTSANQEIFLIVKRVDSGGGTQRVYFRGGFALSAGQSARFGSTAQVYDSEFAINDATDTTKQITFDAAGTTGTKTTITGSQTANRVQTLQDATDTFVYKNTTDVLTNKNVGYSSAGDSTTTGSNASLQAFTSGIVRLTNASLVSVSGIPAGTSGQSLIVENKTGAQITINNEETTPTAANRIQTGSGANASMPNNASFVFIYDSTSSRWQLTGSIAASTADVLKQHKNYVMNGAMEIAQRGTSFVAAADSSYNLDRFQYFKSGAMVHTISQDTDVPTLAQASYVFNNSLRLNLTTADTSIAAGDYTILGQKIEGYNYASFAQKAFVLSFWVKATATGTYCVGFQNAGADRSYVAEYTVNSTATWEYKTISVTAPPSAGTWDYTNGIGLRVHFTLAAGSTYQTTAGTWQTGNFHATSNQVNGVNTGATDFRITGIQVQEGTVATPFRLYGDNFADEFRACERFYEKSYILSATPGSNTAAERMSITVIGRSGSGVGSACQFRTVKRAAPTMSLWNNTGTSNTVTWIDSGAGGSTDAASTIGSIGTKGFQVTYTTATNGTVYVGLFHFAATADL